MAIFGMEGFTKLTAAERAGYMAQLGLSDPLWLQYLHWIRDIATGRFGHSFSRAESVGLAAVLGLWQAAYIASSLLEVSR